jgi:hypothetical protein
MNSRDKGKRGERQWRDELRANGYMARRGQQFSGSPDSPDVVCDQLRWIHFEVKAVERLNIEDAMEQARRDAQGGKREAVSGKREAVSGKREAEGGNEDQSLLTSAPTGAVTSAATGEKVPIVAHRRKFRRWLVTMEAETFFRLLRGDVDHELREIREKVFTGESGGSGDDFKGLSGPANGNNNNNEKGNEV